MNAVIFSLSFNIPIADIDGLTECPPRLQAKPPFVLLDSTRDRGHGQPPPF